MIQKFLKAKHWQLFILFFGVPLIFQLVVMPILAGQEGSFEDYFTLFALIMLLVLASLYGWMWSIGVGLQTKVPEDIHLNVKRFKIFLIIPLLYISFIFLGMAYFFGVNSESVFIDSGMAIAVLVLLHLFSMFCMIYCFVFCAKTIKTVELQRTVKFGDFVGEFFLMWFNIIGIWILQPRINKMITDQ